jgi:citrate synthase
MLSSAEAASRLGVKLETLYAYVSRGLLRRNRSADGRRSWFDPAEVERLASRGRHGAGAGGGRLEIESGITAITPTGHSYRGVDAVRLAAGRRFEEVATWLWTGRFGEPETVWRADQAGLRVGRAVQEVLRADTLPLERLRVIVAALATADDLRLQLDPPAVVAAGQSLLAAMVESLPNAGGDANAHADPPTAPEVRSRDDGEPPDFASAFPPTQSTASPRMETPPRTETPPTPSAASPQVETPPRTETPPTPSAASHRVEIGRAAEVGIAKRLWGKLTEAPAEPSLVGVLDAALVLLADHELAASTLAARAAASVRADPYAVVSAGLAVASGTLHAGASLGIETLLAEAGRPERAARAVGERLRRGDRIRGFGHFVYTDGDPRATYLLERLRALPPAVLGSGAGDRLAVAEAVLAAAAHGRLPPPNVDFALATLSSMTAMIPGAGEAIFVVARTAGWLAHAIEEYQRGVPLRPRATYTGPVRAPDG